MHPISTWRRAWFLVLAALLAAGAAAAPVIYPLGETYATQGEIRFDGYTGDPSFWSGSELSVSITDEAGGTYWAQLAATARRNQPGFTQIYVDGWCGAGYDGTQAPLYQPDVFVRAAAEFAFTVGGEPVPVELTVGAGGGQWSWTLRDLDTGLPVAADLLSWSGALQPQHAYALVTSLERHLDVYNYGLADADYISAAVYAQVAPEPGTGALFLVALAGAKRRQK